MLLTWKVVPMMKRVEIQNTQLSLTPSVNSSKESVMRFSRSLFQLAPSAHRTDGTGCGLLHTPRSSEHEEDRERFVERNGDRTMECYPNVTTQIAMMPLLKTPSSVETEGGVMEIRPGCDGHYKLRDQIAMLPTPDASDRRSKNSKQQGVSNIVGTSRGLKLQPAFVEWMQGYPLGFTHVESPDSRPSATPSSRKSPTKSSRESRPSKGAK
jgi:hypothetical protein